MEVEIAIEVEKIKIKAYKEMLRLLFTSVEDKEQEPTEFEVYWSYLLVQLGLNAGIEFDKRFNRRNFTEDPYYKNYDRFTPVSKHKYYSFEEWKGLSEESSQLKREFIHRSKCQKTK